MNNMNNMNNNNKMPSLQDVIVSQDNIEEIKIEEKK